MSETPRCLLINREPPLLMLNAIALQPCRPYLKPCPLTSMAPKPLPSSLVKATLPSQNEALAQQALSQCLPAQCTTLFTVCSRTAALSWARTASTAGHHVHTLWPLSPSCLHAARRLTVVRKQSQASTDQGGTPGSMSGTPGGTSASQVNKPASPSRDLARSQAAMRSSWWWVSGSGWLGTVQMHSQHTDINGCRCSLIACLILWVPACLCLHLDSMTNQVGAFEAVTCSLLCIGCFSNSAWHRHAHCQLASAQLPVVPECGMPHTSYAFRTTG